MSSRIEVRRRLWVWDARLRPRVRELFDGSSDGGLIGDIADSPVGVVTAIVVGLVLLLFLPWVFFALEVALLVVVSGVAVVARLVLRRPWVVEARHRANSALVGRWEVNGFRAAGRAVEQLQRRAAVGHDLPPDGPYDPAAPPRLPQPEREPLDDPTWPTST